MTDPTTQNVDPNNIHVARNLFVDKTQKFTFRTGKETGVKRPSVTVTYPVPTVDGVITALSDPKQQVLITDTLADLIKWHVAKQIGADNAPVDFKTEHLDLSKLSLEAIANLDESESSRSSIPDDLWDEWEADYRAIMPGITGKDDEKIKNAVTILRKKFAPCKSNKQLVSLLKDQLDLYFANSKKAEEFVDIYELLEKKAKIQLEFDDKKLMDNL